MLLVVTYLRERKYVIRYQILLLNIISPHLFVVTSDELSLGNRALVDEMLHS